MYPSNSCSCANEHYCFFFRFYLQKEYHVSGFHFSKWLLWKRVLVRDRGGKLAALSLDNGEISTRFPIVCGADKGLGITLHCKSRRRLLIQPCQLPFLKAHN